jgi:SAM-dependent methyltransferase
VGGVTLARTWARTPTTAWSVWKFHWMVNRRMIRALERARVHARGALLDLGCGARPFEPLFAGRVSRYWGTDLSRSPYLGDRAPDAFARAEGLPIRGASVDTVLGLSMLTYLEEPLLVLREAHRVLRPGGVLLLEFTQMAELHDEPDDYFRFTRFGAESLLRRAGFETIEAIPIGSLTIRVGTAWTEALNRVNRGPWRVLTEVPVRVLYIAIHVAFEMLDAVFPTPREVLGHLVVARKPS